MPLLLEVSNKKVEEIEANKEKIDHLGSENVVNYEEKNEYESYENNKYDNQI